MSAPGVPASAMASLGARFPRGPGAAPGEARRALAAIVVISGAIFIPAQQPSGREQGGKPGAGSSQAGTQPLAAQAGAARAGAQAKLAGASAMNVWRSHTGPAQIGSADLLSAWRVVSSPTSIALPGPSGSAPGR